MDYWTISNELLDYWTTGMDPWTTVLTQTAINCLVQCRIKPIVLLKLLPITSYG